MSLERVIKALESLGLSHMEARIYVFLEKTGAHEDVEIAQALKIHMKELTNSLKILKDKRIVEASLKETSMFSAVSFKKAINLLIELRKEQAKSMQERKVELLSIWQKMKNTRQKN